MQKYLLLCGCAGSSLEVKPETDSDDAMGIKTEADSNDITEFLFNDHPFAGMFAVSDTVFSTLFVPVEQSLKTE